MCIGHLQICLSVKEPYQQNAWPVGWFFFAFEVAPLFVDHLCESFVTYFAELELII